MGRKRLLINLLLFLLINCALYSQVNPVLSERLQHALDSVRTRNNAVGISAAVILPDESVWLGVSGMSDPLIPESLSPDMILGMGSISKTFTSAVILQLASENKLTLDDPLYRWLPHYNNIDSTITIKQLLSHTSGIYNYTNSNSLWNLVFAEYSRRITPGEILSLIQPRLFAPGTSWSYSNTNFILLGLIIEKVTGNKISTELHDRLLTPLGLNNTFLDAEDTITIKVATCWYDVNSDGVPDNFSVYPRTSMSSTAWAAGGMYSNPGDLVKWVKRLYNGEVVNQEYLNMMRDVTVSFGNNYGLGLMRHVIHGNTFWGHGGSTIAYNSYAGYSEEINLSVAAMVNQTGIDPVAIASALVKTVKDFSVTYSEEDNRPGKFSLSQNYPNPFNPETRIKYSVGSRQHVTIKVFNLLGNEIATLLNEEKDAGDYEVVFNASLVKGELSSGMYLVSMKAGNFASIKKIILIK